MKTKLILLLPLLFALTLAPAGAAVRLVNLANPGCAHALVAANWCSPQISR